MDILPCRASDSSFHLFLAKEEDAEETNLGIDQLKGNTIE